MSRSLVVSAALLFSLALAVAPACGVPVPPCGPPPGPVGNDPNTLFLSPGTVRLTLPQPTAPVCTARLPERAVVTVYDPHNQPLPSSLALLSREAHVSFDAGVPGWYHVAVTFEPNLGISQADLLAASDRRTGFVELPGICDQVWLLGSGASLCDSTLHRGPVSSSTQRAPIRLVSGRWAWEVLADGTLQRREDLGSGDLALTSAPLRLPSPPADGGADWVSAAATGDELFALSPQRQLLRFGVVDDAGSPELRQLSTLSVRTDAGIPSHLLAYPPAGSLWLSVGLASFTGLEETALCPLRSARDQPLAFSLDAGCLRVRGKTVGLGDHGFWVWPETESTLHFIQVDDAGARSRASAALPRGSFLTGTPGLAGGPPQISVFLTQATIVPRFDGQEVVFDAFDPEGQSTFRGASPEVVWLLPASSPFRTRVFQRAR